MKDIVSGIFNMYFAKHLDTYYIFYYYFKKFCWIHITHEGIILVRRSKLNDDCVTSWDFEMIESNMDHSNFNGPCDLLNCPFE
jgi:hypothetical protein